VPAATQVFIVGHEIAVSCCVPAALYDCDHVVPLGCAAAFATAGDSTNGSMMANKESAVATRRLGETARSPTFLPPAPATPSRELWRERTTRLRPVVGPNTPSCHEYCEPP
jgi:hypothetical protein